MEGFLHCFPPARRDAENLERSLGRSLPRRETHLTHATSYFLSAIHTLRKLYPNQKQTGVLPGKNPCRGRDYALKYFVNSIYSPSVAQRPIGFQQVSFSRHSSAVISNALPFFSLMRASIFRCYD
jgi:hypothetical protein